MSYESRIFVVKPFEGYPRDKEGREACEIIAKFNLSVIDQEVLDVFVRTSHFKIYTEEGADDYWDSAWKDEYQTYIINTKSKKFHLPDGCNGLPSEENSELVEDTYNNLIAQGYSPCGNCFK